MFLIGQLGALANQKHALSANYVITQIYYYEYLYRLFIQIRRQYGLQTAALPDDGNGRWDLFGVGKFTVQPSYTSDVSI